MPEKEMNGFDKKVLWLLSVLAVIVGAWVGIEARIDAATARVNRAVCAEATERKEADQRMEDRHDKAMSEIRTELRELNRHLRGGASQ
jgi:hypothetical protein